MRKRERVVCIINGMKSLTCDFELSDTIFQDVFFVSERLIFLWPTITSYIQTQLMVARRESEYGSTIFACWILVFIDKYVLKSSRSNH